MRQLSKIIASALVAATALGATLPAQAQSYPRGYEDRDDDDDRYRDRDDRDGDRYRDRDGRYEDRYDRSDYRAAQGRTQAIRAQIEQLRERVARIDRRDRISEREAAALRNAVQRLRQDFRDYSRNGLSQREFRALQDRIQNIRQRLRFEQRDNDGRRW